MVHGKAQRTGVRLNRRVTKSIVAACALALIGYGTWIGFGVKHSIANGGQIFAHVSAIGSAIPGDATNVITRSSSATWITGCSEIHGARSGWTTDYVSISFIDHNPRRIVIREIASSLRRMGWQRHDSSPGPRQGAIPHWTFNVRGAHVIQAWAFPVGAGTHHWFVSSSWRPPGPTGQGCP